MHRDPNRQGQLLTGVRADVQLRLLLAPAATDSNPTRIRSSPGRRRLPAGVTTLSQGTVAGDPSAKTHLRVGEVSTIMHSSRSGWMQVKLGLRWHAALSEAPWQSPQRLEELLHGPLTPGAVRRRGRDSASRSGRTSERWCRASHSGVASLRCSLHPRGQPPEPCLTPCKHSSSNACCATASSAGGSGSLGAAGRGRCDRGIGVPRRRLAGGRRLLSRAARSTARY